MEVLSGIPGMCGVSVCANRALFSNFSNVIRIQTHTSMDAAKFHGDYAHA